MKSQIEILNSLIDKEIGIIESSHSIYRPFQGEMEVIGSLKFETCDEDSDLIHSFELSPAYPFYKLHDNRSKLKIEKESKLVEGYRIRKVNSTNIIALKMTIEKIHLYEESKTNDHFNELYDYPLIPSTLIFENTKERKYLIIHSYKDPIASYMKQIKIRSYIGLLSDMPKFDNTKTYFHVTTLKSNQNT